MLIHLLGSSSSVLLWTAINCGHGRMHVMNGENNPLHNELISVQPQVSGGSVVFRWHPTFRVSALFRWRAANVLLASRFPPLAYSITFCSSHLFLAAFFQAVWRAKWLRAGTSRRSSHGPLNITPPMILLSSSRLIFWSLDVELGTLPLGTVVLSQVDPHLVGAGSLRWA